MNYIGDRRAEKPDNPEMSSVGKPLPSVELEELREAVEYQGLACPPEARLALGAATTEKCPSHLRHLSSVLPTPDPWNIVRGQLARDPGNGAGAVVIPACG